MRGLDLLGLGDNDWNLRDTIRAWPKGFALGFFADDTFGKDVFQKVSKLVTQCEIPAIRPHLNWSDDHSLPPLDKIKRLAPKWEAFAKANPGTRVYVSPTCEYDSTNRPAIKAMLDLTARLCPSCTVVASVSKKGAVVDGYMLERHGKTTVKAGQIISYDGGVKGEGLFDIDALAWAKANSAAEIMFSWGPRCNGTEKTKLPRPKRTAFANGNYIKGLARLLMSVGNPPTPTFVATPLKKPSLLKSFAEDQDGPNQRDNKLLIILPKKTAFVEVVTFTGASLGKLMYYGGYPPNLHRYYSGMRGGMDMYAYEIAAKALAVSGYEFFYVKQGKDYHGPLNAFRSPYFQQ